MLIAFQFSVFRRFLATSASIFFSGFQIPGGWLPLNLWEIFDIQMTVHRDNSYNKTNEMH